MKEATKYADLTDYPELFEDTYWGSTGLFGDRQALAPIVASRNAFVEAYDITEQHTLYPDELGELYGFKQGFVNTAPFWDHIEVYSNEEHYIIVSSPYSNLYLEDIPEGFRRIAPLYNSGARSFMAKLPKNLFQ